MEIKKIIKKIKIKNYCLFKNKSSFLSLSKIFLLSLSKRKKITYSFFILLFLISSFLSLTILKAKAFIFSAKTETIRVFPEETGGSWFFVEKAAELPDINVEGNQNLFSDQNSAVYLKGSRSLTAENFSKIEEEVFIKTEEEQLIEDLQNTENFDVWENYPDDDSKPTEEKNIESTENGNQSKPENNAGEGNVKPEETPTDNSSQETSFFKKIFDLLKSKAALAENLVDFDRVAENSFVSAKLNLSMAVVPKEKEELERYEKMSEEMAEEETEKFENNEEENLEETAVESQTEIQDQNQAVGEEGEEISVEEEGKETREEEKPVIDISDIDIDSKVLVFYSVEDGAWEKAGSISGSSTSNAENQGYFSYGLEKVANWEDLKKLKIRLEGVVDGEVKEIVFVDSLWIDAEYMDKETEANKDEFELISRRTGWELGQEPLFGIQKKDQGKIAATFEKIFYFLKEKPSNVRAEIFDVKGKTTPLKEGEDFEINYGQEFELKLKGSREFKPGKYKLKVYMDKGDESFEIEDEFYWGVLAINFNKSVYLKGEIAHIQMATLNDAGETICDAELEMEILKDGEEEPKILSTKDGTIERSEECGRNTVTDVPDYSAYFELADFEEDKKQKTKYQVKLTARTIIGEKTIEDGFFSARELPFEIERIGATRIYPMEKYRMNFKLKSNVDFEGKIIEEVPASFEISKQEGLEIENAEENKPTKLIKWEVKLKEGEEKNLSYEYDAPDISPYLFLLGTVKIDGKELQEKTADKIKFFFKKLFGGDEQIEFEELRNWQIASDAVANMILFWDDAVSDAPTGWTCISCTGGQDFYQKFVRGNSSGTGSGGGLTHDHTGASAGTSSVASLGFGQSGTAPTYLPYISHTHTASGALSGTSGTNVPAYRNLKVIKYDNGIPTTLPAGVIAVFDGSTPAGWTAGYNDNNYIRGENTANVGVTSGSNTHSHSITFSTGTGTAQSATKLDNKGTLNPASTDAHTHSCSGATASDSHEPPYMTVNLAEKDGSGAVPTNMIAMFDATPPSADWTVRSDTGGNFFQRFIKPTGTYGTSSDTSTHTHTSITASCPASATTTSADSAGTTFSDDSHTHTFTVSLGSAISHLAPYHDAIFAESDQTPAASLQQTHYHWRNNNNSESAATSATSGTEDTALDPFYSTAYKRLRMEISNEGTGAAESQQFRLEYGVKSTACADISTWVDVGAVGGDWDMYNSSYITDGNDTTNIAASLGGVTDSNPTFKTPNGAVKDTSSQTSAITLSYEDFVELEYSIEPNVSSGDYCFRITNAGTATGFTYSSYAEATVSLFSEALNQRDGIIENDEDSSDISEPHTAEIGERLKVRIQVDENYLDNTDFTNFKLQYDKNDSSWTTVAGDNEIRPAQSMVYQSGESIGGPEVGVCGGSSGWKGGSVFEKLFFSGPFNLKEEGCHELSFLVDTANATANTTYRFRLYNATAGEVLDNYYAYPSFTTVDSTNNDKSYSIANSPTLPTARPTLAYLLDQKGYTNVATDDDTNREIIQNNIAPTSPTDVAGLELNYPETNSIAYFGYSAASGDFNGDGYSDALVGAYQSDNPNADEGAAYIFYGSPIGITTNETADVELNYPEADTGAFFGSSAASGDFNGDGYCDALVGARSSDNPNSGEGAAYIFYGSNAMPATDDSADLELNYPKTEGGNFGWSAASGDFNGDGYSDALVGARYSDNPNSNEGAAYIFYGSSSMPATDDSADAELNYPETDDGYFGTSAATGDFNGDGYSDALVGAIISNNPNADEGAAYIFYGSSSMPATDDSADVELNYPEADTGAYFGQSAASGDFNGDGYSDALVGADSSNNPNADEGAAYIFYGSSSMPATDDSADVELNYPETDTGYFGSSTASGDFNGDGYSDALVGADSSNNPNADEGAAYIFYGSSSMPATDDSADVELNYPEADTGAYFGSSAASGDFNGDGYSDALVGAELSDNPNANEGAAYIFYMGANMSAATDVANRELNYPETDNGLFGWSATTGDFNGDGYSDALVGAYQSDNPNTDEGAAYIFFGQSTGLGPASGAVADVELNYPETDTSAYFGSSAASGDFNGDGYADTLVGAFGSDNPNTDEGAAYIFFGSSSMPATDDSADVELNYPEADTGAYFGFSAATGDFNGDGYSDALVGAYSSDNPNAAEGAAYIFYGASSMPATDDSADVELNYPETDSGFFGTSAATGDFNGDGFSDALVGAYRSDNPNTDEGAAYIFYGFNAMPATDDTADAELNYPESDTAAYFGWSATTGDFNGDGFSDALVGAYRSDNPNTDEGAAYIFYGSGSMPATDNSADIELNYPEADTGANFGTSAASGDFNGDGYIDALVGAYASDNPNAGEGAAYIFYGSSSMPATDDTADVELNYPETDGGQFGYSAASGDFNGDGYSDALVGATYSDNPNANEGAAYIFYGAKSSEYQIISFSDKSPAVCSSLVQIDATWNGQSSTVASSKNIVLQVYRFGSTNDWETVTTNSTLAINTDADITGTKTSSLSEYCDGSNWSYWRVYQDAGNNVLRTDEWSLEFTSSWTTLNQRDGIIENDQDSSDITEPHTAEIGERLRVKFQIDTDSGDLSADKFLQLQYDKNDTSWVDVAPDNEIRPAQSIVLEDKDSSGGPDVAACQGGTTWNGEVFYNDRAVSDALEIEAGTCKEITFIIDTENATQNTTYNFRLYNLTDNGELDNYYGYPQITTVTSATNTKSYSIANSPTLPTERPTLAYLLDTQGYTNVATDDDTNREIIQNNIAPTSPTDVAGLELNYPETDATAYFSWSAASGDFNGDGYSDALVGASYSNNPNADEGAAYIFYGSPIGITTDDSADVELNYPETDTGAYFGWSAATGDFNGDGYSDALVGASYSNNPNADEGAAYIFFGSSSMPATDDTADVELNYPETDATAYFGQSATSGDFNGDGYSDALVGANSSNNPNADEGAAYIFFGSSSMPATDDTADVELNYPETDNARFGHSASSGDFDDDGYDDALVGAYQSDNPGVEEGAAYIFYGSNEMPATDDGADVELNYPEADTAAYFGVSIDSGDFNGDGNDDALIGAYSSDNPNTNEGAAYIFYGSGSMPATDDTADAELNYPETDTGALFGYSAASGDFNGDGFSDALVGARNSNNPNAAEGAAYIFYGSNSMPATDDSADMELNYPEADTGAWFGASSAAGDFNGDGYSDALVGAYTSDNPNVNEGAAYIFYMGVNLSSATDVANRELNYPETDGGYFGRSVASGDFNGDGYRDALVGASSSDNPNADEGAAYIFFGQSTGLGPASGAIADAELNYPETDAGYFGISATSGDFNGDGYSDALVGANSSDNPNADEGAAYIFYGSNSMPATDDGADVELNYPEADTGAAFGASAASGDFNGDGYADALIGASDSTNPNTEEGAAYIFYGSNAMPATDDSADVELNYPEADTGAAFGASTASGDFNGDGYGDALVGASSSDNPNTSEGAAYIFYGSNAMPATDDSADVELNYPEADGGGFGASTASGDFNGDGYGDALVGASLSDNPNSSEGAAYIFYGSNSMPATDDSADAELNYPETDGGQLGCSAASGDFNADGYSDALVGAFNSDNPNLNEGAAYIFYGSNSMPATDDTADAELNYPETDIANFGYSAAAGDFNGDGYSDALVGAYASDNPNLNEGAAYIFYGAKSSEYQIISFSDKSPAVCSSLVQIDATWNGQSSTVASSKNIVLQVYRFGSTNDWETVTTNSTLAINTDADITGTKTSSLSEYCDGSNWSYWRVYQDAGNNVLRTDEWVINFTESAPGSATISGSSDMRTGSTVRVAVNGVLDDTHTGTISAVDGSWSIASVPVSSGNSVVVFVEDSDGNESTAITLYDGSDNIGGMVLNQNVLSIGNSDNQSLALSNLDDYQNSNNENVMHSVASSVLTVDDDNVYSTEKIDILSGNTLTISGTETLTTYNIEINGTLTSGGNSAYNIAGSWDNNGTFTCSSSTATFNGTTAGLTISDGGSAFNNLSFTGSSGEWLYKDGTSTAPSQTSVSAGTPTFLNAKTGTVSVTSGTLNVDWYVGVHIVNAAETSTNVDTGDTDVVISEAGSNSVVWKYNSGWGSAVSSQTTGTGADGKNPQPENTGAIRIREYSMTASASCPGAGCTLYQYNAQVDWQTSYGEYDYHDDYGDNYITSCWAGSTAACSDDTTDDDVIGVSWYRATIGTMNTYPTVNEPPTTGSWYLGMLTALSFTLDAYTKDFGDLTPGGNPVNSQATTVTVTTSASNGYIVYARSIQPMTCSDTDLCGTADIDNWGGTNAIPTVWNNGEYGFGYSTNDITLQGTGVVDRFSGPKYAGFIQTTTGFGEPVADRTGPSDDQANIVTYQIAADAIQNAGDYDTDIVYIIAAEY